MIIKTARSIMIQGTCSNAGKSILTAALCRIFRQDGYRVAPFKAQNMALNSFVTADGLEMGRAQVVQAQAASVLPDVRMNPILLKPTSTMGSQVIINGVARGNRTAQDYWSHKKRLRPIVQAAYESLAADFDIVVIEGAGSPAEINLKQDDIVNMGMAQMANAPVLLVGDIDRGGVFASLYGTVKLLEPDEQDRIRALVINKFRGDIALLQPGLMQLEKLIGKPVAGVIPYTEIHIDAEDSLSNPVFQRRENAQANICIIALPHLSNATDFTPLSQFPTVSVWYADKPEDCAGADLIIFPGTKNTMSSLRWLRETGIDKKILQLHASGVPIFGICGGYQLMGQTISDPDGVEGGGEISGLGLLPVDTVFQSEKITVQTSGCFCEIEGTFAPLSGLRTAGYEIHMGHTTYRTDAKPLQTIGERADGCQFQNAYGTYQHGILDDQTIVETVLCALLKTNGENPKLVKSNIVSPYDKLAATVRGALDMSLIYRILEGKA